MTPIQEIHDRLLAAYGPQHWWPGESPFEILVGTILVQNTNWSNVERAIANLRAAGLLDPLALDALSVEELAEQIRPAGYYRVKAQRLRNLLRLVVDRFDGSLARMAETPLHQFREMLLGVKGIGPETADSILLYACGLPTFVVDTYTYRVTTRHGWVDFDADYELLKDLFESRLEPDAAMFNEYHALLVRVGKEHCRKRPICTGCPLAPLLPAGGPLDPDS